MGLVPIPSGRDCRKKWCKHTIVRGRILVEILDGVAENDATLAPFTLLRESRAYGEEREQWKNAWRYSGVNCRFSLPRSISRPSRREGEVIRYRICVALNSIPSVADGTARQCSVCNLPTNFPEGKARLPRRWG